MEIMIDGLKIQYSDTGSEGQPVLLLHGWGSSSDVYKGIISALSDKCRMVALNFPGCGGSETMEHPWNIDDYCTFVLHFLEKTGLENPILFGHSHGGRVIIKLVGSGLLHPPKIVLLDSAGIVPKKSLRQKIRLHSFKTIKAVLTLPGLCNHTEELLNRVRSHYGSADYNAAPEVLRKTLVSLVNTDVRDILPGISCPTLLIWGENDTATPLGDAKLIEKLVPDAGLCVIKGTGHYSFCERPFEAHAILRSFI